MAPFAVSRLKISLVINYLTTIKPATGMKVTGLIIFSLSMKTNRLILLAVAILSLSATAQDLKTSGKTADELVPSTWHKTEAKGDLDGDGIADLAIIATPDFKQHLKVREDGYVYNFNQPILAIYRGNAKGGYSLWKRYNKAIMGDTDEYNFISHSLSINSRKVLKIGIEHFSSAGSYTNSKSDYLFRYQNGDFFLIGEDTEEMSRNTGKIVIVSKNYLTGKQCRTVSGAFVDSNIRPSEKWSTFKRTPLRPLGSWIIEE